jgi:hypothetical protein
MMMKTTLAALIALLLTTPALADDSAPTFQVEISSVKLVKAKADGKPWDQKIPLKAGAEFPDIFVEVVIDSQPVLKTPVQKDSTVAEFSGQSFSAPKGKIAIIKIWDKDLAQNDSVAELPLTIGEQSGEVVLKGGQAESVTLKISEASAEAPAAPAAQPAAQPAE